MLEIIGIERLQAPAPGSFVDREDIQGKLWRAVQADDIAVVGVTATGGIGKSTAVQVWLTNFARYQSGSDCANVFKFPDAGTSTTASSERFFADIFQTACGSVTVKPGAEASKAEQLFAALSRKRAVLVLDGLEYLQRHQSKPRGEIFDVAIRNFLTETAKQRQDQKGRLVIVTSRESLVDLSKKDGYPAYREIDLSTLDDSNGAKLLHRLGVKGEEKELRQASAEYCGHALTLVLLGRLITSSPLGGDTHSIGNRHLIDIFAEGRSSASGGAWDQAHKILTYYKEEVGAREEIMILKLMALQRRALSKAERQILVERADFARELSNFDWETCCDRLEQLGLLLPARSRPREEWDSHPLIREHFRTLFKSEAPEDWRQAHGVLFDYFAGEAKQKSPDEGRAYYHQAIHHSCLAERFNDALSIYRDRILGGIETLAVEDLKTLAEDSAALRMFFPAASTHLIPQAEQQLKSLRDKAWLQARTAFCLTHLGRLEEAKGHRQQELGLNARQAEQPGLPQQERRILLKDRAHSAGQLAELEVLLGDLAGARESADESVALADQSGIRWQQMDSRCRRATIAHMQDERALAEQLFREAMAIQRELEPQRRVLYSDRGFHYRRLTWEHVSETERHRYADLLVEAQSALDIDDLHDPFTHWWVAVGLDYLSQACAFGGQATFLAQEAMNAKEKFELAYKTLIESGSVIYLPEFFISRAQFHLNLEKLDREMRFKGAADEDAQQALRKAEEYCMPLAQADSHLLLARCLLDANDEDGARISMDAAQSIIDRCRYERRRAELHALRNELMN